MTRRSRRRGDLGALGAAGWLFAELALVLVVIAFGSEAPVPAPIRSTGSPAIDVGVTTTTPPASEQGLRLDTVTFAVLVPADGTGVVEEFRAKLVEKVGQDQRIGLVLLFGVGRDGRAGPEVSRQLMDIIVAAVPQVPRPEQIRPYLGDEGPPGTVTVELFLLTGPA